MEQTTEPEEIYANETRKKIGKKLGKKTENDIRKNPRKLSKYTIARRTHKYPW